MNTEIVEAGRDTSGGYKVDMSRGANVDRVSSEWFSRPEALLNKTCEGFIS